MSAEMITVLASTVGLLFALAGGFGWMIHRMDRIGDKLGTRIERVEHELGEVKVAVARLEGPLVQKLALPR